MLNRSLSKQKGTDKLLVRAALISTVALAIFSPLGWPPAALAFNIVGPTRLTSSGQQQPQQQQQQQQQVQSSGFTFNHQHNHRQSFKTKSDSSSSSFFSTIEDLGDSNIKTRTSSGAPIISRPPELIGDRSEDFDRLLKRIYENNAQIHKQYFPNRKQHLQNEPASTASADANNKTTMRFFRNNKTFASIVYTNERLPLASNEQTNVSWQQPCRLINCHLVDLEKHSSDVALFETKYDIRTLDIEFRDMMQLIDACTNIARFKPFLTKTANNSQPTSGSKSPVMVVGRPNAAPLPNSVATFQTVMTGQLNQQLTNLGPTIDDSNKLDLPESDKTKPGQASQQQVGRFRRRFAAQSDKNQHQQQEGRVGQVAKKLSSGKLVLSEVTAPPNAAADARGGIKEALQEITSYDTTDLMSIWRGILPGTNWCGMGDRATSYNDLGFESDIDICCRAHDFCPIRLSAFSSGYGLFNWSFYTRSHCWCDQNFLDCLQRAKSPLSSVVMKFYFTIMKTTCLSDDEANFPSTSSALAARRSQSGTKLKQGNQFGPIQANQQQQQLLYDQIRASMPIPAQRQSQLMQAKLELNNSLRRN